MNDILAKAFCQTKRWRSRYNSRQKHMTGGTYDLSRFTNRAYIRRSIYTNPYLFNNGLCKG